MDIIKEDDVRTAVRDRYAEIAEIAQRGATGTDNDSSCCGNSTSCCSSDTPAPSTWAEISVGLGYSDEDVAAVPHGSNLGLGCGNPQAIADLRRGETVLDLGSGAGFDCFLAARQVGESGSVIGVDMTPQMIQKARDNARVANSTNIEFRLGEIEQLPVADDSVDVIMSNCVINLSPDKERVFREAFRVLKPGGRLAVSDIVASAPLPDHVRRDLSLYTGCMAGASEIDTLREYLTGAGFSDVSIKPKAESREFIRTWAPEHALEDIVVSAVIQATKPAPKPESEAQECP